MLPKKNFFLWGPLLLAVGLIWLNGVALGRGVPEPALETEIRQAAPDTMITATSLLPVIAYNATSSTVDFIEIDTSNAGLVFRQAFLSGEAVQYWLRFSNTYPHTRTAELRWSQGSPCAPLQVMTATLELEPGIGERYYATSTPDCLGIYTHTVQIVSGVHSATLSTRYVATELSTVIIENRQAFDRCYLPTVEQMQTWWNHSPYWTFNVYLGGISFFCWQNPLDAFWIDAVARQGWSFILTWVGPQAPCSRYQHPMSWDPAVAYQQGRAEADLAVAAAENLGFLGEKIIYYDVESYSGATLACRNATAAFIEGWVRRLHELGTKAGAYGSACSSYMVDWVGNDPAPDDVWIAHWYKTAYTPDVTVWETPCLGDIPGPPLYWINHQRLKQYAGDHVEIWGSIAMTIDSNVMDGEVTALDPNSVLAQPAVAALDSLATPAHIRAMGLLAPAEGWVLLENQLFWTWDGGSIWAEIQTPLALSVQILDVYFIDTQQAWLVSGSDPAFPGRVVLYRTDDAGQTWQSMPLAAPITDYAGAALTFVDPQTGWVVLEEISGSSFSRASLLTTQDGGYTWQVFELPVAGIVHFVDARTGWLTGGPDGHPPYRTTDGGATWTETTWLALPAALNQLLPQPEGAIQVAYSGTQHGWALVQQGSCQGQKNALDFSSNATAAWRCQLETQLWQTRDGGLTWQRMDLPVIK